MGLIITWLSVHHYAANVYIYMSNDAIFLVQIFGISWWIGAEVKHFNSLLKSYSAINTKFFLEREIDFLCASNLSKCTPVHWLDLWLEKKTRNHSDQMFSLAKESADLACGLCLLFSLSVYESVWVFSTLIYWKSRLTTEQ